MTNIKVVELKNLKPVTPGDKLLKLTLDRASTQTVEKHADPDICPECNSMTHTECEIRQGGYQELVRYCYGCGATQTS